MGARLAPGEADWAKGMNTVVCTVSRSDGSKLTGKIDEPGTS